MTVTTLECPKCFAEMSKVERSGVVIDRCTSCGGIFLDRGELQALLSAESDYVAGAGALFESHDAEDDPGQKRATRRGFLEELFDFS